MNLQTGESPGCTVQPSVIAVPQSPAMPELEVSALRDYLGQASSYLEYGSGGSTLLAARTGVRTIYSVESDPVFRGAVLAAFKQQHGADGIRLFSIHVDIGPTQHWGYPVDAACAARWPLYPEAPWRLAEQHRDAPDLILIDGRFRVASFLMSLCMAKPGTVILFDDYADRPHYHLVERYCPVAAMHGRMAAFRVTEPPAQGRIVLDIARYVTVPA